MIQPAEAGPDPVPSAPSAAEAAAAGAPPPELDPDSLAAAVGSAGDAVLVVNRQGSIVYANAAAETLFQYPPNGLIGLPFGYPVADSRTTEVDVLRRGEAPRVAEMHVSIHRGDGGPLWIIILRDVTGRRARESRLWVSDERLSAALMAGEYGLWDVDLVAGRAYLSGRGRNLFDLPAEAPLSGPGDWLAHAHPADRSGVQAALDDHLAGRTPFYEAEYRIAVPGAGTHWVLDRGQVTDRAADGTARRLIGTTVDVTERHEREMALADHKRFLETLLDTIPNPVFYKDQDLRFMGCNSAFADFLGVESGEVAGRRGGDLGMTEAEWHESMDRALLEGGTVQTYECEVTGAESRRRFLVSKGVFADSQGNPQGIVGVMLDITARERFRHELERSNAELAQFASVISHDLQEPLRNVTAFLELLERRVGGDLPGQALTWLEHASAGARRMQHMVGDLLDYARVNSRGSVLEAVDAGAALERARRDLETQIAEAGARVEVEPLPAVRADAGQLTRVFQNLIGNALKYRDPDRPLTVTVTATWDQGQWCVSVADTGRGIPEGMEEEVFGLFRRAGDGEDAAREPAGHGAGLAITKRIVERHGGRIWYDSVPGAGTAFRFTLPAALDPGV